MFILVALHPFLCLIAKYKSVSTVAFGCSRIIAIYIWPHLSDKSFESTNILNPGGVGSMVHVDE